MFENVGHTIQKILNNTPVSVSSNVLTSSIATNGGDVYMAGFIGNKVQSCFENVISNSELLGKVVETQSGENKVWLLTECGFVYEYDFNRAPCGSPLREIYCPRDCCGDKAIKIAAGRDHVIIITDKNRIFGAGDNSEYQIVPQGQARYECATEIIITDTLVHDDCCCDQFDGVYHQLTRPKIPNLDCGKPVYAGETFNCKPFGYLVYPQTNISTSSTLMQYAQATGVTGQDGATLTNVKGSLLVPIFISYSYSVSGFVNTCGILNGSITVTVSAIYFGGCTCPTTGESLTGSNIFYFCTDDNGTCVNTPIQVNLPSASLNMISTPITITDFLNCIQCTPGKIPTVELNFQFTVQTITNTINPVQAITNTINTGQASTNTINTGQDYFLTTFSFGINGNLTSVPSTIDLDFYVENQYDTTGLLCGDGTTRLMMRYHPATAGPIFPVAPASGVGTLNLNLCSSALSRATYYSIAPSYTQSLNDIQCETNPTQITVPNTAVLTLAIPCCLLQNNNESYNCCGKEFRDCCPIPQPCWKSVYAGFNVTALVDSAHKIYVLGSLHRIRSNKRLRKKHCLERLLEKTTATVTLPADQLNCCLRPKNGNCKCNDCRDKCFKTDLTKFGIQLCFDNGYQIENETDGDATITSLKNKMNVCDFLKQLQNCNDYPNCQNTCEPCETVIYLNICGGACPIACGGGIVSDIGTITLYNRKSVTKLISQTSFSCTSVVQNNNCGYTMSTFNNKIKACPPRAITVDVDLFSNVEFDLNKYNINTADIPLDAIVILSFNNCSTINVNLYLDICRPGTIRFTSCSAPCTGRAYDEDFDGNATHTVNFPIDNNTQGVQFAMDFGCLLDPVELTNFKLALGLGCGYPSPCYQNPIQNKLILAYLRGGDRVKFISSNNITNISYNKNITDFAANRFPVTADLPTVFYLRRKILDIGVGKNNLSVLIGNPQCPNEVMAIGENCYGELGTNCNETLLCFRKINRCFFDCEVEKIFSGVHITFYITRSYRVYASGAWKCLGSSNIPVPIPTICQAWKIVDIGASESHVIFIGKDGTIVGLGDNNLGQLGLGHTACVTRPAPLTFFYRLNQCFAKKFNDSFNHPVVKKWSEKTCRNCYFNPCRCQPCTPAPPLCIEERDPCCYNGYTTKCSNNNECKKEAVINTCKKEAVINTYKKTAYKRDWSRHRRS